MIKVNEKFIPPPQSSTTTTNICSRYGSNNLKSRESKEVFDSATHKTSETVIPELKHQSKRQKLNGQQQSKQRQQHNQKLKHNQLASPPQDQVSSTQDQVGPEHDDHDCQTSPMMLISTNIDDLNEVRTNHENPQCSPSRKHEEAQVPSTLAQSSPIFPLVTATTAPTTTTTVSASTSTSPSQTDSIDASLITNDYKSNLNLDQETSIPASKKRTDIHNSSNHDTPSTANWSSPFSNPTSPASTSSVSSDSSDVSSVCSSSISPTPSPSPLSSPDIVNELKGPRLKLSEDKIKRIKKRPISFDDYYFDHSFASTPTTSSICSPGQNSNATQNSDQSRLGLSSANVVIHMFQAPPKFVNNLKPCNLPSKPQQQPPSSTPPAPTREMLNCAICGIKDRPPNITKMFGQNSCSLCNRFFSAFLKRPQQLYCAQDGDCLMTFDSRCQACWIKICLQKFDIEEEHRKVGQRFSPKLLSSPNVSLITIDTSLTR